MVLCGTYLHTYQGTVDMNKANTPWARVRSAEGEDLWGRVDGREIVCVRTAAALMMR